MYRSVRNEREKEEKLNGEREKQRPLKCVRPIDFAILRLVLWALESTGLSEPRPFEPPSWITSLGGFYIRDQNLRETTRYGIPRHLLTSVSLE